MKKFRWPIALIAVAVFAFSLPLVASASHSWGKYAWPNNPTLDLGNNLSSDWDAFLVAANTDWNFSPVITNTIGTGYAASTDCIPGTGRVEICNSSYGNNGWLGLAQIWVSGDHIVKAVAKMNDTYHDISPYNQDGWRDMVVCQEVGHAFGLGH